MRLWLWALLMASLVAGCKEKDPQLVKNSFLYCSASGPVSFNPQLVITTETLDATAHQLYDRLLTFESHGQDVSPGLAVNWQRSEDGLRYRLTLRKEVAFHHTAWFVPSRPFNADDVVFSFTRLSDTQHAYHNVSGGKYPFFNAIHWQKLVNNVHAVNEHEVEFVLNYPDADFLSYLASDYAVILSAQYGAHLLALGTPQLLDRQPVGTGPFLLALYRPDEFIRYQRHPNYWQAQPSFQQLVFDITPKSSKRLAKLLSGECDAMANPAASQLEVIANHPDLALSEPVGMNVAVLALNTQKPPLTDLRVRKAISLMLNREDILQAVYFGHAQIAKHLLTPTSWARDPLTPSASLRALTPLTPMLPKQNNPTLTKARALLADAGVSEGFTLTLLTASGARAYNPDSIKTGQLLQQQLAPLGITLKLRALDEQVLRQYLIKGEHDAVLTGWSADLPSPTNLLRNLLSCTAISSGTNASRWCNPAFEAELNLSMNQATPEYRHAYYQAAQYLAELDVALIPLIHSQRHLAFHQSVSGLQPLPYGGVNFQQVAKD
ncbi:ABC transporter substrate-binding protein [Oceanisphaera avium]|uniref:ABC transporter substrate-binding protein n=1 Tax=Oceanisphaera avium TaxID=1903694 RepID=A0A1Y0CUE5_9GAMM|nr:ABC transporter substrate-binding protein [Oceanisphaera avium]ART78971.1 ABC transporter substrate-binding protein [Oceanisphaera avium]